MKLVIASLSVLGLATVAAFAVTPVSPATTLAPRFSVDPVHSSLVFKVRYAGVTDVHGRFNEFSGFFSVDGKDPESAHFDITVKAESVDTGNSRRDGHLKSPDFFSAKQFPEMTFKSTSVKAVRKGDQPELEVTGDLTLRGVTKKVTAKVRHGGVVADPRAGTRAGFDGTLTISRKEFGVSYGEGVLGDEVTITMGLTGTVRSEK